MNTQKVLIGGVVVAVLLSVMAFFHGGSQGPAGSNGSDGTLGVASGPDSYYDCESHNGVTSCFANKGLQQATTTICSIKSPSATSTLSFASLHMNVATTGGATTLTFARAAFGASASTSPINGMTTSIGSGAEGNAIASTSIIFTPNQMLNVTQAGGGTFAGGTFSEQGSCQAVFTQLTN